MPTEVRARIRTSVADELFRDEHGRAPLDDRERAGFLDYSAMDVEAYRRQRIAALVALLKHMGVARPPVL